MKTALLKWPYDKERPERADYVRSFVGDADFIIQHVEDLDKNPKKKTSHHFYYNYLKNGFIFSLLRKNKITIFCLKDDFSLHAMLYLIYANKMGNRPMVLSHGIKHSSESLLHFSKNKIYLNRLFLNFFRYSKLLLDFFLIGITANVFKYLKVFYWYFRHDKFTYVQKTIRLFNLKFDFYCFNTIDIEIQKKMLLGEMNHQNQNIDFKIMPFPYHRDLVKKNLTLNADAEGAFVFFTSAFALSFENNLDHLSDYFNGMGFKTLTIKLHPKDYSNVDFINKLKTTFDRVEIIKNISDDLLINELRAVKFIYSFYSTIILPIIGKRDVTLITNSDQLHLNPTINDIWSLGMIDILEGDQNEFKIRVNPFAKNLNKYLTNYGLN